MKIQISVTEEDIREGVPDNCTACPIALAAHRAGLDVYAVHPEGIEVFHPPGEMVIASAELPQEAIEFINAFDTDGSRNVKPFVFEIELEETA